MAHSTVRCQAIIELMLFVGTCNWSISNKIMWNFWNNGSRCLDLACQQAITWRHQMETFSALLAIYAGNSPVTREFPAQRPVTRSFDVFICLLLNKRLSKQSRGWWFETPSCPLWRHYNEQNVAIMTPYSIESLNFVVIGPGDQLLVTYSYLKSNTFVLHSPHKLFENVADTLNLKWIYSAFRWLGYTQNGHKGPIEQALLSADCILKCIWITLKRWYVYWRNFGYWLHRKLPNMETLGAASDEISSFKV